MEKFNNMIRRLQDFSITSAFNSASQNLIANQLLTFLFKEDIQFFTLEDLADYCHASTATFSRFIRDLGYSNFKEFKQLAIGFQSESINLELKSNFTINNYNSEVVQSINETALLLEDIDISSLVDAICEERPIYFLGIHYTEMLLKELQYNLLKIKKQIYWTEGYLNQLEMLDHIEDGSVCVFFSFGGRFIQGSVPYLVTAKEHSTTYLITSKNNAMFESFFDHTLYISEDSATGHKQFQLQFFVDVLLEKVKQQLASEQK